MILVVSIPLLRQLFYFAAVGITATITNYLVALLFHEIIGLNVYAAQLAGYCFAVAISLFGHSKLTFYTKLTTSVFIRFVIISLTTLWLSEILLLCIDSFLAFSHRITLFIVAITIPVITFFLSKFWVFNDRKAFNHNQ